MSSSPMTLLEKKQELIAEMFPDALRIVRDGVKFKARPEYRDELRRRTLAFADALLEEVAKVADVIGNATNTRTPEGQAYGSACTHLAENYRLAKGK